MSTSLTRAALAATLLVASAGPVAAQTSVPESIVSIYRAAPGQQAQLMQWLAKREEATRSAGVGPDKIYVHQSGASWDFVVISPMTSAEQDTAIDAATQKMGLSIGPKASLEIRQFIAEHSDTRAAGPLTATEWVQRMR